MPKFLRVGLAMQSMGFYDSFLRGVSSYARPAKDWLFYPIQPKVANLRGLLEWKPDGILAGISEPDFARELRQSRIPVVCVGKVELIGSMPRVGNDDPTIGGLGAAHFLERGLRNFAYLGHASKTESHLKGREIGFVQALKNAGSACAIYPGFKDQGPTNWRQEFPSLRAWLHSLPRPVGILACNDNRAWQAAEVCRASGLRVPEDLAILGVDNDETICHLAYPPISSIAVSAERIGSEAAALLEKYMLGKSNLPSHVAVPPMGVVTRHSTEILAISDPVVSAAVKYIGEHAHEPIRVHDILRVVPTGRRVLERRFRLFLDRSPQEEIRRKRIERAKWLLVTTNHSMPTIAKLSGFSHAKQLSLVFNQETGNTPREFRQTMSRVKAN